MNLVDTHTHLDGFHNRGELSGVLSRAAQAGVGAMITVGTEPEDWALYRGLAAAHPGRVFHTAGLHPCSVDERWEAAVTRLPASWDDPTVPAPVALGECGLDRFHLPKDPAAASLLFAHQRAAFSAQLALALRLGCPVVVHSRGAFRECVELIEASGVPWTRIVFHCFSEGPLEMTELARLGATASFTGILTYKNAENVRQAARVQGLGRLLLETDAPFLSPVPRRGEPNEPAYLAHTAAFAAALFGVTIGELARVTTANARAFYGLKLPD